MLMINLRARRLMAMMKQKDIASYLGITYQQYQKYEYGLMKPNIKRFMELARLLNVPNNIILDSLLIDYQIINAKEAVKIMQTF